MYVFVRSPPLAVENSQRQHLMHNNVIRLRSSLFLFQAAYKWRIPKNTNRPIASHDDVTQERRYFVALFAFYETITRRYHPGKVTQRKRPLWIVADKANLRYSEYSDKKDVFFFCRLRWTFRFSLSADALLVFGKGGVQIWYSPRFLRACPSPKTLNY